MNGFYWIYLLMLLLTLWWTLTENKASRNKIYYLAWALLMIFYVAQDISVSVDLPTYRDVYGRFAARPWSNVLPSDETFEAGFVILNRLLSQFFVSDRVMLLAAALVILVPYCLYAERETEAPMLAMMCFLALGIYMHALIYIRQFMAMGIMTFAYRYVRERKPLPFFLLLAAAMLFHKSALLLGILYFAYLLPVDRRLILAAAVCAVLLAFLGRPILIFVVSFLYPVYLEHPELLAAEGGVTMLVVLWIFVGLCWLLLGEKLKEPRLKLPFLMLLIAAVLQPVALAFYNWSRVVVYFRVSLILLVPELYRAVMSPGEDNRLLALAAVHAPRVHRAFLKVCENRWFHAAVQVLMFAVLFFWYRDELDVAVYTMAPI